MRNSQKASQSQMLLQLHESKYNPEGTLTYFTLLNAEWEDFDDYFRKYNRTNAPEFTAMMESQMSYFEGLGVLVKNKTVDVNTVYLMMGRRIASIWVKYETVIKGLRAKGDYGPGPDYCENFEYLASEILKIRKQRGLSLYLQHQHPTSTAFNQ
jgi:hypothetical protein